MRGLYGFSGGFVFGAFRNITHGPICNCWLSTLAIPRTRKRDSKKILLATHHRRNYPRRNRNIVDVYGVKILRHTAVTRYLPALNFLFAFDRLRQCLISDNKLCTLNKLFSINTKAMARHKNC